MPPFLLVLNSQSVADNLTSVTGHARLDGAHLEHLALNGCRCKIGSLTASMTGAMATGMQQRQRARDE
jgi:hypothetical protein